jgi:homocysteine S-methyltransferase
MRESTILTPQSRAAEFREALFTRPVLVADGAMGTMLLARRALVNRSLDELNLSLPALVRDVHQDYLRAGAEILETNTFGANRPRLAAFGFGDRVRAVNQAGVRIAREAALARGSDAQAFVAGAVGPLGVAMEPFGSLSPEAARAFFREQIDALVSAGVDLLMLETFRDLEELHQAVLAARESAGPEMVVIAQLSVEEDGSLADGTVPEDFTRRMDQWPVDAIGLNCCSGPSVVLDTIQRMIPYTTKPLSAMPNAGLPVAGEYSVSPEYMARYAARFVLAGVRIVGGCCGVTPEHIRAIADEVRMVPEPIRTATVMERPAEVSRPALENLQPSQKSRLGEKIVSGRFVTLAEIQTPRGVDPSAAIESARQAKAADVDAVVLRDGPGARLSAAVTCQTIERELGIETILPIRARGRNTTDLVSEILGAHVAGLRNVLCLSARVIDSVGLAHVVNRLNRGLDLGGNALGSQTTLLVGVSVNPAAPDTEGELQRFEAMVRAGADFAITRPVFDGDALEAFLQRMQPSGVPVIVGIRPLHSFRDAEVTINEHRVPVPAELMARLSTAQNDDAAREGSAIARELLERVRGMSGGKSGGMVAGVYWIGDSVAPR